ncbi:MAG: hypothetical protein H7Y20_12650 [Bryobacteraceae bacterium]|nr:hypothetical protein [Bryobacteraceae bacterium]
MTMRGVALALLLSAAAFARIADNTAGGREIPRVVLGLYDSRYEADVRDTEIHRLLEMPLNHLGLQIEYHDINSPLPDAVSRADVRGVFCWFQSDAMKNPSNFLQWANTMIDSGKKFVLIGDLSTARDLQGRRTSPESIQRLLNKIGIRTESDWQSINYRAKVIHVNTAMFGFERKIPAVLPPWETVHALEPEAVSHLRVRSGGSGSTDSDLVVTSQRGGYIAANFTHYFDQNLKQLRWYVNPFEFLRIAFATDDLPKPDTTTLAGRRIYYSQIDGDGWRNRTQVPQYRQHKMSAAEVVLRAVIETSSDLPVTVAPVAADLDPAWYGSRETGDIARRFFRLDFVEPGTHTYSHPLDWETLGRLNAQQGQTKPTPGFLPSSERISRFFGLVDTWEQLFNKGAPSDTHLSRGHEKTRSYNLYPFDIEQEVTGSTQFIEQFCPPGKKIKVIQWSGSTMAFEKMIAATRTAGLRNINGGDTRLDPEFPSYAWVAPLSRQVGSQRQIYSSNSNENSYTELWTERFFGFRYLKVTIENTGHPRRVKPIDLYYHMYSGEKLASLNALLDNIRYIRTLEIAPITTAHFAGIADGFFSTRIENTGPETWTIKNRDLLDTIRFDSTDACVDYARSSGILGERISQGSLYVALDPAETEPIVAMGRTCKPASSLIESRWPISRLRRSAAGFQFSASGFGQGRMSWRVQPNRNWSVTIRAANRSEVQNLTSARDGTLAIATQLSGYRVVSFEVSAQGIAQ